MTAWARLWKRAAKKCRAKSAERLAVINELVSAIGAGDYYGHVSISDELAARIRSARSDQ